MSDWTLIGDMLMSQPPPRPADPDLPGEILRALAVLERELTARLGAPTRIPYTPAEIAALMLAVASLARLRADLAITPTLLPGDLVDRPRPVQGAARGDAVDPDPDRP
jgi:hypothetical protein